MGGTFALCDLNSKDLMLARKVVIAELVSEGWCTGLSLDPDVESIPLAVLKPVAFLTTAPTYAQANVRYVAVFPQHPRL